jgi:hypothetical protein
MESRHYRRFARFPIEILFFESKVYFQDRATIGARCGASVARNASTMLGTMLSRSVPLLTHLPLTDPMFQTPG